MANERGFEAIIEAGRKSLHPYRLREDEDLFVIPYGNDGSAAVLNLEAFGEFPSRPRGTKRVYGAAAFCQLLLEAEADAEAGCKPSVYIDRDANKPQIVAVLNDDNGMNAGWRDYRVEVVFKPTPQWLKWTAFDGKWHAQTDFADFIEENRDDIAHPTGAHMLEIATYLEATKSTSFKSGIRLQSGDIEFENIENTEAKVGRGKVVVPEEFRLALTPFVGGQRYEVPARFRYRLTDGKLKLGFLLQRREDLMRAVVDDLVAAIEKGTGRTWPLEGEPPPLTVASEVLLDR